MASESPTAAQVLSLVVGVFARVLNPGVAQEALRAAASQAGISIEPLLQQQALLAVANGTGGSSTAKKGRKPKKEPKEGSKPRALTPYVLFISKAMERIKEDESYQQSGPDGKSIHPLSIAAHLWKDLGDEKREAFSKAFAPLIEELKTEREASGHKAENLVKRVLDFESKLDKTTRAQMAGLLPAKLPIAAAAAASARPDSDSDSDSDDDSDDEEEQRKAREAAAREAEEEAKKKKKESKKARKSSGGDEEEKKHKHHKSSHKDSAKKQKKESE